MWKKGESGNPLGQAKWRDKPISIIARHHAPAMMNVLVKIAKDENAPKAARVAAGQAVIDRAWGKAPTFSTSDPTTFKRAVDMTDDELAAIASRALTIVK
jgi:hypothetical protein